MCPVNHIRQGHVITSFVFGFFCLIFLLFCDVDGCIVWLLSVPTLSNSLCYEKKPGTVNSENNLTFFWKKEEKICSLQFDWTMWSDDVTQATHHCSCFLHWCFVFCCCTLIDGHVRVRPSSTTGNPLHPDALDRVPVTATPVSCFVEPRIPVCFFFQFLFSISVLLYLSL